jgi:hypothetical protein
MRKNFVLEPRGEWFELADERIGLNAQLNSGLLNRNRHAESSLSVLASVLRALTHTNLEVARHGVVHHWIVWTALLSGSPAMLACTRKWVSIWPSMAI